MKFYVVEDKVYTFKREATAYAQLLADERQEPIDVQTYAIEGKVFRQLLQDNPDKWDLPSDPGFEVAPTKPKRMKKE